MFCKNCGKEVNDHSYVCIHCGVKLAEEPREVEKKRNNAAFGLGIAGFVISIVSAWLAAYFCISSILAIVLSAVSISLANKNGDRHGIATAGLIVGIVFTVLWGILWIAGIGLIVANV